MAITAAVATAAVSTDPQPAIEPRLDRFPRIPIIPPNTKPMVIGSPMNPIFCWIVCGFSFSLLKPIAFRIGSKTMAKIPGSMLCIAMMVQFGY